MPLHLRPITVRSRLGDLPGLTDETVAVFDRFDPLAQHVVRHYVLLEESVKLMHEPWGWKDRWYVDLVGVSWADAGTLVLDDLWLDVIVEGGGPTYRMIDLEELAEALAGGQVTPETLRGPLTGLQFFLDAHLHGGKDFPPAVIGPFRDLPPLSQPLRPDGGH